MAAALHALRLISSSWQMCMSLTHQLDFEVFDDCGHQVVALDPVQDVFQGLEGVRGEDGTLFQGPKDVQSSRLLVRVSTTLPYAMNVYQ